MDHLIKSFIRVHRQVDDADKLCEVFPDFEATALTNPAVLSDEDKRRVLDFPPPEVQDANITAVTSLSKSALLQRAAESPEQLTQAEVDLLKDRYWLNLTGAEAGARSRASAALVDVSQEHFDEVTARLGKVREALYELNEAKAIANAEDQSWKRIVALAMGPQDDALAQLAKARPWVRALWDEIKDEPARRWGFAVFLEPGYDEMDDYLSRRDAVLFHARGAICCGETLGARWKLQRLEWPTATAKDDEANQPSDSRFDLMRQQFTQIRDRPPKKQKTGQGINTRSGGLEPGILDNTFLVIDHESINSVMSGPGIVDDMWVWVVDPDFKSPVSVAEGTKEEKEGKHGDNDIYRGYTRVRLQQLTNNFFEQRKFHADEYPLARLWGASKPSKNQAFVSVNEDEAGLWCGDRSVGSAIRP